MPEKMKPLIIEKSKFERPKENDIPMSDPEVIKKLPTVAVSDAARLKADTYNAATRGKHMANEVRYSFFNQNTLMEAMGYKYSKKARTWAKYTDTPRASDLGKAPPHKDQPILIIGSGPTFDEMAPMLKDWKGDIMVSTSQVATCCYLGKEPTYIVALDPNSSIDEMKVDTWEGCNSTLILHPGVTTNLVREWHGPMYLFRKMQPQTPFYDNAQKIGYSTMGERIGATEGENSEILIKATVPMLACVLAAQICIAKQLGYSRQYLVGADLGMPNDQARFTSWSYVKNKWVKSPPDNVEQFAKRSINSKHPDPVIIAENGTPTTQMMVFYAHQIVTAWRITEADIVAATDKGVITIFPTTTPEKIIRKQGKGIKGYNKKQIRWESERYLARQNIYFLYVGKGILPHEFKDPLHDIPLMLNEVEKALKAQNKVEMLDKEANMRRITKLFNEVASGK